SGGLLASFEVKGSESRARKPIKASISSGLDFKRQRNIKSVTEKIAEINEQKEIWLGGKKKIVFDTLSDIVFLKNETLPYHPNALTFLAELSDADHIAQTYYSV
ncbi:MAG: serine dehydratase beta chain, partial [Sphingobacteriales bacterium]